MADLNHSLYGIHTSQNSCCIFTYILLTYILTLVFLYGQPEGEIVYRISKRQMVEVLD